MSKWKCGICNSEFNNYQAQGFNGIIYCPLCYFKELYKREKTKNDKAIEYIDIETIGCDEEPIEGSWLYDLYTIRDILGSKENE